MADDAEFGQELATTVLDGHSLGERGILALFEHNASKRQSDAAQHVHHVGLQFVEGALLVGMCP